MAKVERMLIDLFGMFVVDLGSDGLIRFDEDEFDFG